MAVDIQPACINLGEISFYGESSQSITLTNQSDIVTNVSVKVNKESMVFIKKLNDQPLLKNDDNQWNFQLQGNSKKEMKFLLTPRIPGRFYLPIFVKIGHLEEVTIPITGVSYIEFMSANVSGE